MPNAPIRNLENPDQSLRFRLQFVSERNPYITTPMAKNNPIIDITLLNVVLGLGLLFIILFFLLYENKSQMLQLY